jgi:hypothetical protein
MIATCIITVAFGIGIGVGLIAAARHNTHSEKE